MKKLLIVSCLLIVGLVRAGDLTPGPALVDGQTVHAADFNNLVGDALINSSFYSRQHKSDPTPGADYIVAYSPNSGGYLYQALVNKFVLSPALYPSLTLGTPNYLTNDLFQFYSQSSTNIRSVTFSNLVNDIASNINPVAWMNFAPTNATSGGTNIPVLADWPGAFSGSLTNNQPHSLWWGSNGVPYQLSLSNEESALAGDLGTNLSLPYTFAQMFAPWLVYGTNANFTNAWGFRTNFPITALYLTNSYPSSTNTPTLVDSDAIPVNSTGQITNTTATLGALQQYLAAKNTLPPYTQARVQFNGFPVTVTVSNTADNVNGLIRVATNSFPSGIIPVSFDTNAITAAITTNQLYFIVPQATNNGWLHVYSNYPTASSGTNWIGFASTSGNSTKIYYVTNFTSFNCDAIPLVSSGNNLRTGIWQVNFRTNSVTSLYYVTSSYGAATALVWGFNQFPLDSTADYPATNYFRIGNHQQNSAAWQNVPLMQILVQPQ